MKLKRKKKEWGNFRRQMKPSDAFIIDIRCQREIEKALKTSGLGLQSPATAQQEEKQFTTPDKQTMGRTSENRTVRLVNRDTCTGGCV